MEVDKISSIGRPLDFNYKTNKAIAIITAITILVGIAFFVLNRLDFFNIILQGVSFGFSFFLCWAITREIDPDNNLSAFIGLIPLLVFLLIWPETNLAILFWMLISLRIINRTTGLLATKLDSVMLLVFSVLLSYYFSWIFGFLTALVFLFDAKLIKGQKFQLSLASLVTILTLILVILTNQNFALLTLSTLESASLLIVTIIFSMIIYGEKDVISKGDQNNEPLYLSRLRAAQAFALISALAISFFASYFVALIPMWCAFIGVILNKFSKLIFHGST